MGRAMDESANQLKDRDSADAGAASEADLEARVRELEARLAKFEAVNPAEENRPWEAHWVSLKNAAYELRISERTLRRHCAAHGVGHVRGGRWRVDLKRYSAWSSGQLYPRLP